MKIIAQQVDCSVRNSIPKAGQDITELFNITPEFIDAIHNVGIYLREPDACPFARGNWIIDINFINGYVFCIKLPKEMTEEQVNEYAYPLISKIYKDKVH